jgi:hypothetical protein
MTEEPAAAPEPAGAQPPPSGKSRTRLWITIAIVVAVVVVVGSLVVGVGAIAWTVARVDRTVSDGQRANDACLRLETRLNRLVPPGATELPADRATAIRNENAAVRLFLAEFEQQRHVDDDWLDRWRALQDARTAYAEALARQERTGEPAFFVPPRTSRDGSVTEWLDRRAPTACRGAIHRLSAPDL